MDSNTFNKVSLPDLFTKRLALNTKTEKEIREELISFSELHKKDLNETIYVFVKNILKQDLFFRMEEEVRNSFLFDAIYWSSAIETKKKIRPKNIESVPTEKVKDFYTKLQKEMILSLLRKHKDKEFMLNIELSKYLILFYELSCIKRNRRK
jgi:hypothetical protein